MSEEQFKVECLCSCHMIEVSKFDDEPEIYISFWERSGPGRPSILWRLRQAWNGWRGNLGEEVILSELEAASLCQALKITAGEQAMNAGVAERQTQEA